jgi:hypothetical protein
MVSAKVGDQLCWNEPVAPTDPHHQTGEWITALVESGDQILDATEALAGRG